MTYVVWLEYFAPTPVSKNVKSDEHEYGKKHIHGQQPTQADIDGLRTSLEVNVAAVYARYNTQNPGNQVNYPGNDNVWAGKIVKTKSKKGG
jgi:hypothetical protein